MNYRRHILSLARRMGVKVRENPRLKEGEAWSYAETRTIEIPPLNTYKGYIFACHELGHLMGKDPRNIFDSEIRAWRIARKIARFWTAEANSIRAEGLKTYLSFYKGDKRIRISRDAAKYLKAVLQA